MKIDLEKEHSIACLVAFAQKLCGNGRSKHVGTFGFSFAGHVYANGVDDIVSAGMIAKELISRSIANGGKVEKGPYHAMLLRRMWEYGSHFSKDEKTKTAAFWGSKWRVELEPMEIACSCHHFRGKEDPLFRGYSPQGERLFWE